MKLIIEIPDDDYELVQKYIYPQRVFYELVHGTPIPDNVTNSAVLEHHKTGKWITEEIGEGRKVYCSECKESAVFEYVRDGDTYSSYGHGVVKKTQYCPNCGAKMT